MVLSIKQNESISTDTTSTSSSGISTIIIIVVIASIILIAGIILTVCLVVRKRRQKLKKETQHEEQVNIEFGQFNNNEGSKERPKQLKSFIKLDISSQIQNSLKDSSFLADKINSTTDRKFLEEKNKEEEKDEDSQRQQSFAEADHESRKEEYPERSLEAVIQQFDVTSQQDKIKQLFKGKKSVEATENLSKGDNNRNYEEKKEAEKTTKDIAVANMSMCSDNAEQIESENGEKNEELEKEIENQVGKYVMSESFVPNFGTKMKSNERDGGKGEEKRNEKEKEKSECVNNNFESNGERDLSRQEHIEVFRDYGNSQRKDTWEEE